MEVKRISLFRIKNYTIHAAYDSLMELYDFRRHWHYDRITLVREQGEYIASVARGKYRTVLYNMGAFYAEIWYDVETNEIKLARGFDTKEHLTPYRASPAIAELIRHQEQ